MGFSCSRRSLKMYLGQVSEPISVPGICLDLPMMSEEQVISLAVHSNHLTSLKLRPRRKETLEEVSSKQTKRRTKPVQNQLRMVLGRSSVPG